MPQTREHILLARQVGVPYIVVFLNRSTRWTIPSCSSSLRWKSGICSRAIEFPGDDIPIVKGSALKALEALQGGAKAKESADCKCLFELMDAVDSYIPTPERESDKPFLMPVEDVFSITGRGTVATGRVERGTIKVQDNVRSSALRMRRGRRL